MVCVKIIHGDVISRYKKTYVLYDREPERQNGGSTRSRLETIYVGDMQKRPNVHDPVEKLYDEGEKEIILQEKQSTIKWISI